MSIESLNKLNAWREAKDFAVLIYKTIIPKIPQEEKWGIGQQLRRASQSISTNIAEGFSRYYYQDMVRFCYIARGSLEETISLVALCSELEFIGKEDSQIVFNKSDQLIKIINGYIAFLKKSKQGGNEITGVYEAQVSYGDDIADEDDSLISALDSHFNPLTDQ